MRLRMLMAAAWVLVLHGCGGSEFQPGSDSGQSGSGGAATGGTGGGGTGGTSASGGIGGAATGGTAGGAGTSNPDSGLDSGADAISDSSTDASNEVSTDASVDAGPAPIVVVQASETKLSEPSESVSTLTMPDPSTPGNAIIAGITCISDHGYNADAGVGGDCILSNGGVTDSQGNTYVRVLQGSSIKSSHEGARGYVFIAENIAAPGSPLTISVDPAGSSGVQRVAWGAIEVSGLATPPSFQASGISQVTDTGTFSTTATTDLATTQPNELAVAVLTMRSDDTNMLITRDGLWVSHHINQNSYQGAPPGHSMVSKVLTITGIVSHTWSHDSPDRGAAAVIATFKGASQN